MLKAWEVQDSVWHPVWHQVSLIENSRRVEEMSGGLSNIYIYIYIKMILFYECMYSKIFNFTTGVPNRRGFLMTLHVVIGDGKPTILHIMWWNSCRKTCNYVPVCSAWRFPSSICYNFCVIEAMIDCTEFGFTSQILFKYQCAVYTYLCNDERCRSTACFENECLT